MMTIVRIRAPGTVIELPAGPHLNKQPEAELPSTKCYIDFFTTPTSHNQLTNQGAPFQDVVLLRFQEEVGRHGATAPTL